VVAELDLLDEMRGQQAMIGQRPPLRSRRRSTVSINSLFARIMSESEMHGRMSGQRRSPAWPGAHESHLVWICSARR
jgi:hypothetical protein